MSTIYKRCKDVPTELLARRLKELAQACERGFRSLPLDFTMRVPAEVDRDADLVMSESARRLAILGAENERLRNALKWLVELESEKEENGESELYLENRDKAWGEARFLVGRVVCAERLL
jgi:hypothetical protein